ncbi:MAG: hypothetical protein ACOYVF_06620 [Candidatus Zixiibacteriota bacterium]
MKKIIYRLTGLFILAVLIAGPVQADWVPEDGHKMHYPQLPDEDGFDINATDPLLVADDWRCSASGPITEIHFWGSWLRENTGNIIGFYINIYSDIPADPPQIPYSQPGELLWRAFIDNFVAYPILTPESVWEGWYDPSTGLIIYEDHQEYWMYNITDIPDPFVQELGTVYWLGISAVVEQSPVEIAWGWKTSLDVWNDLPTWLDPSGVAGWQPIKEPVEQIYNEFYGFNVGNEMIEGWGTDAYGKGWYYYPPDDWWNIWFYDHPYDERRFKEMTMYLTIEGLEPSPVIVDIAFNWSTPEWSLEGNPPTGERFPPLPGVDEDLYIEREIVHSGPLFPGQHEFRITEPFYNPEWVSVDIRGINYIVNGVIEHSCFYKMNQAFVINNPDLEPHGSCCWEGGLNCGVITELECYALGGQYNGDGTFCLGDLDGNGYDDICDACCVGNRGNVNCSSDDEPDISDITRLIDFLYISHAPLCCVEEADVNGSGATPDISDITRLIDYLYISHSPLVSCP